MHLMEKSSSNAAMAIALGGTLSSYAFVLMALHFLMAGLETPVIPSLQKSVKCHSRNCKSKTGRQVLLYHDHQLIRCDARYHDCVHVKNSATSEYLLEPHTGKNDTITYWESKNKDTVSRLLHKFFVYYSNPNNRVVSIITSDGKLYNQDAHRWNGQPIIVQDPFILTKNVARSCTTIGATAIFQEFSRAAMLTSDTEYTPYTVVCDRKQNLPRPLDTECMQYRFHKPKQTTTTTTLTEIRAKVVKQQQQQQPKEDQVIGCLEDIKDNEQLEYLLTPFLVDDDSTVKKDDKNPSKPAVTQKDMSAAVATAAAAREAKAKQEATALEEKVKQEAAKKEGQSVVQQKTAFTATKATASSTNAESVVVKVAATSSASTSANTTTATTATTANTASSTATQATSTLTKNQPTSSQQSTSQNNSPSAPILNLVQKLISYQSTTTSSDIPDFGAFEKLTSRPCTDMQKLLDDPCMSGVDMKDICYLIAQLNFLGDAIAERVLNPMVNGVEMKSKIQEFIDHGHMALIGEQLREMAYGKALAATAEDDSGDNIFEDYDSEEEEKDSDSEEDDSAEEEKDIEEEQTEKDGKQNDADQAVPEEEEEEEKEEEEETDDDDDNYEDIDSDEEEEEEQEDAMVDLHAVWSEQSKLKPQRQTNTNYKDNDMVDVYFYVKDVPDYIDSYEIYLQFDWYGKVIEMKPAETANTSITWHVRMKMLYKTYKRPLPIAIELGNSPDEVYSVTTPQLAPHCV